MADAPISGLPELTAIEDSDLILIEHNNAAYKVSGSNWKQYFNANVVDASVVAIQPSGNPSCVFNPVTKELTFYLPTSDEIVSCAKTSTVGLVDTWTCTTVLGETFSFNVTNGGGAPASAIPLADVAGGAVGTAEKYAREDHQHPLIYPDADNVQALALDGHSVVINVVNDLDSFKTGVGVFQPSTTHSPFSSWGFVTSAGDSYTRMQVAYSFDATVPPKRRDLSAGTWSAWKYIKGIAYNSGDVFDSSTKYIVLNGFITSGTQDLFLDLPLPASVDYVTNATVNSMVGLMRGAKGYLNSDASEIDIKSSYNVTVNYLSGNHIRINVSNTNGFTNVDNNTPVSVYAKIKVTFS